MGECTEKRYSTNKLKRFQARVAFNDPGKPGQICWEVAGEPLGEGNDSRKRGGGEIAQKKQLGDREREKVLTQRGWLGKKGRGRRADKNPRDERVKTRSRSLPFLLLFSLLPPDRTIRRVG